MKHTNRYFIGDLHIGHENMAFRRGYDTLEEYHITLISTWNTTISNTDIVYICGDLAININKCIDVLTKLNGKKVLILGNHDTNKNIKKLQPYLHGICSSISFEGIVFTHIPVHPFELERGRSRANVHAHLHEKYFVDRRYTSVSVERIGLKPLPFDYFRKQFNGVRSKYPIIDSIRNIFNKRK